jgi:hypothetical protein
MLGRRSGLTGGSARSAQARLSIRATSTAQ